jgi:biopolymer transport protein ExbB/TolQ
MIETFQSGGVMMWPMLAIALGVAFLAARAAYQLGWGNTAPGLVERSLQSLLFWGAVGLVLGVLGTVVGLVQMAQAIARVGGPVLSPATLGDGFGVTLITMIFGLLLLLAALILWFGLRQWLERETATRRSA